MPVKAKSIALGGSSRLLCPPCPPHHSSPSPSSSSSPLLTHCLGLSTSIALESPVSAPPPSPSAILSPHPLPSAPIPSRPLLCYPLASPRLASPLLPLCIPLWYLLHTALRPLCGLSPIPLMLTHDCFSAGQRLHAPWDDASRFAKCTLITLASTFSLVPPRFLCCLDSYVASIPMLPLAVLLL